MASSNEGSAQAGSANGSERPELARNITVDESTSPRSAAKGTLLPHCTLFARSCMYAWPRSAFAQYLGTVTAAFDYFYLFQEILGHHHQVQSVVFRVGELLFAPMSKSYRACKAVDAWHAARIEQHDFVIRAIHSMRRTGRLSNNCLYVFLQLSLFLTRASHL
jgi:hypothetical protein